VSCKHARLIHKIITHIQKELITSICVSFTPLSRGVPPPNLYEKYLCEFHSLEVQKLKGRHSYPPNK
jgi:hypothetical protein